jgi:tRNA threonylcarbamoyladenosine biosynthesis protein TsaB
MRILAIETIEKTGSVAVLDDNRVLVEKSLESARRSLQTLAPAIQEVLSDVGWKAVDVELVAVATGPGSFTGLRIGVTTAKTFAFATGAATLGVSAMAVLAARVPSDWQQFSIVIDAQREELFVADFTRADDGTPREETPTRIVSAKAWLESLSPDSRVSGPGLVKWHSQLPPDAIATEPHLWTPRASDVGRLAFEAYRRGERQDTLALVPQYLRRTAAEEQWERKQGK